MGILAFNMLVGVPPFQARGDAVFKKIKTDKVNFPAKYVRIQPEKKGKKPVTFLFRRYQGKPKSS